MVASKVALLLFSKNFVKCFTSINIRRPSIARFWSIFWFQLCLADFLRTTVTDLPKLRDLFKIFTYQLSTVVVWVCKIVMLSMIFL